MTQLKRRDRPLWYATGLRHNGDGPFYLVAFTPSCVMLRLKGRRDVLMLPWNVAYTRAATMEAGIGTTVTGRKR